MSIDLKINETHGKNEVNQNYLYEAKIGEVFIYLNQRRNNLYLLTESKVSKDSFHVDYVHIGNCKGGHHVSGR